MSKLEKSQWTLVICQRKRCEMYLRSACLSTRDWMKSLGMTNRQVKVMFREGRREIKFPLTIQSYSE